MALNFDSSSLFVGQRTPVVPIKNNIMTAANGAGFLNKTFVYNFVDAVSVTIDVLKTGNDSCCGPDSGDYFIDFHCFVKNENQICDDKLFKEISYIKEELEQFKK